MRIARILLPMLLALCSVSSYAQNTSKKWADDDDLHIGMVKWSERKLRWDDFRASNPRMDKNSSHIALYAKPRSKSKVVDGINYKYIDWESYMVQNKSWQDAHDMNESKLKHCQNLFDLWELLVRYSTIEYAQRDLSAQYSNLNKTYGEEADWMEKVTDHGLKTEVVDSIANELAMKLAEKELNPADIVEGYAPSRVSWMLDAAIVLNVPFSNNLSMSYGFSGGCSYNRNDHLMGFDIDMTFAGKSRMQILAKKGHIEDGDRLLHGGMTFYYGYNVYDRNSLSLTPFIGAGVRFFDGGEMYEEFRTKNNKEMECAGFSFGAGVMTDFKLKHTINSRYTYLTRIEATETKIRVKPYLSFTRYGKGVGWVTALNLCVGINGKSYKMKVVRE